MKKRQDGSSELYSLFDFNDFRENMDLEKAEKLVGRFFIAEKKKFLIFANSN